MASLVSCPCRSTGCACGQQVKHILNANAQAAQARAPAALIRVDRYAVSFTHDRLLKRRSACTYSTFGHPVRTSRIPCAVARSNRRKARKRLEHRFHHGIDAPTSVKNHDSRRWNHVQSSLIPFGARGSRADDRTTWAAHHHSRCHQPLEAFVPDAPSGRRGLVRTFFSVLGIPNTRVLSDRLGADRSLGRVSGWERRAQVPSDAFFARLHGVRARRSGRENACGADRTRARRTHHWRDRASRHRNRGARETLEQNKVGRRQARRAPPMLRPGATKPEPA